MRLTRLGEAADAPFPPVESALRDPPGLLAWGGDLSRTRLCNSYAQGIFPWFSRGQPILWWSPDPRMVLRSDAMHLSRRARRALRGSGWRLQADQRFAQVVDACARAPRPGQHGTWITSGMRLAYLDLHRAGLAHSIEVIDGEGELVGGLYGVRLGSMVFGESMFSGRPGGSKLALAALCQAMVQARMPLLDCQMDSAHLRTLGALPVPRRDFLEALQVLVQRPAPADWPGRFLPPEAALLA